MMWVATPSIASAIACLRTPPPGLKRPGRRRSGGRRRHHRGTRPRDRRHAQWNAGAGEGTTDLFILPGFQFKVTDLLVTNFHLPRSTLIALVASFIGPEWRDIYGTALRRGYRFLSFGDAMLAARRSVAGREW